MPTATKSRRPKQATIPEADTPLSKAVDSFLDNKQEMADLKEEQKTLEEQILVEMKKEGRDKMRISHDGNVWEFELLERGDALRCVKATRDLKSEDQEELPGTKE